MAFGLEIKRLREEAPISAQKLADLIGIRADRLRKWEEKDLTPRIEDVQKIESFFQMDLEQIMDLRSIKKFLNVPREPLRASDNPSTVREAEGSKSYIQTRRENKGRSDQFLVPLVPVKAQAGYARSYSNVDFVNNLEMRPILPNIDPRGAVWRYFEIQGDSMIPTLFERDCILVSMVPPEDWKDLRPGQVYVIITGDDTLVKIVYPIDGDTWVLASSNKKVKQKKIFVADVSELWQFRGLSTRNLVIPKIEIKT